MDNIFDLLFGSLYDKAILKIKRMRARIILRRSRADLDWFNDYKQDPRYMKAILFDENLLNLFIDKAYRKELCDDPELRKQFIQRLEAIR